MKPLQIVELTILIMLAVYGNIGRVVLYQPQKKYVVAQRKASGDSRCGGLINPQMR